MLYQVLKITVRLAMKLFCRKVIVNKPALLAESGPLLLACNHPNSFLDGVILATLFDQPLYSLVRGDVFRKGIFTKMLRSLNLLPVYRISEGVENLGFNYDTFADCRKIFQQNGIVIIFSEGNCINEWRLRPLKKGTARLTFASWADGTPLRVLPVGINYSSFRRFGKNVFINFGEIIGRDDINSGMPEGAGYQQFNSLLERQLKHLVYDIDKNDFDKQKNVLEKKPGAISTALLWLPAWLGWFLHIPLYLPVKGFTLKRTDDNDHYDSVLTAILLFAYPFYLLFLALLLFVLTGAWWPVLLPVLFPFSAWAYVQVKPQLDRGRKDRRLFSRQ